MQPASPPAATRSVPRTCVCSSAKRGARSFWAPPRFPVLKAQQTPEDCFHWGAEMVTDDANNPFAMGESPPNGAFC